MTAQARRILEEALALTEAEREVLADALNESLLPQDGELSAEWKTEVVRRIAAVERGESRLIPGDEVEARIRATP